MSIYRCKIRVSIEVFEVPRHQNQAQINAFYHYVSALFNMCRFAVCSFTTPQKYTFIRRITNVCRKNQRKSNFISEKNEYCHFAILIFSTLNLPVNSYLWIVIALDILLYKVIQAKFFLFFIKKDYVCSLTCCSNISCCK